MHVPLDLCKINFIMDFFAYRQARRIENLILSMEMGYIISPTKVELG